MAEPDPHAWRGQIEPAAIDSGTGDGFSLQISAAISAKRTADALERIAGALDGTGKGATLHDFVGHIADAARNNG